MKYSNLQNRTKNMENDQNQTFSVFDQFQPVEQQATYLPGDN